MSDPPSRPRPHASQDPLVTPPGSPYASAPLGSGSAAKHLERGTVLSVDARRHVYRVALASGRTVTASRILPDPSDATLLQEHTAVAVTFDLGAPYILGVLPPGTAHNDEGSAISGQDGHGGQDPVFDRGLPANGRNINTPTDIMPGDAARVAPGGATVAALRGGVATLAGGPLARIDAFGAEDRLRLLAGELRVETWMGTSEVVNEDGRVSYRWRGGSDQMTQTGAGEGRYTLHLDVGHSGDLVLFRVTNREGQDLFRVHVTPEGRVELLASGGVALHGGDRDDAQHETSHHGSRTHHTTRNETHEVGGARTTHVGDGDRLEVDGGYEVIAVGAVNIVGADRWVAQSGGELVLNAAGRARISGDGVTIVAGLTSDVLLDVTGNDRVRVGRSATSHAVKHEELVQALAPLVNAVNELRRVFATHSHPGAGPNPVYIQYGVPLQIDFTLARSSLLRLL